MLFVQVFVVVIKKIASEIERDYIIACGGCHAPELIAATKFKTTKINFGALFGLSAKINAHENYPLYGTCDYNLLCNVNYSDCDSMKFGGLVSTNNMIEANVECVTVNTTHTLLWTMSHTLSNS